MFGSICIPQILVERMPFILEAKNISWGAQIAVEILCALYLLDLISGLVHMHLDYSEVKNDELRLHVETSINGVEAFEKTDLFKNADPRDQYLWNFHVHHDAPYPAMDSETELIMQIVRPLALPYACVLAIWYFELIFPPVSRVVLFALSAGPFVSFFVFF